MQQLSSEIVKELLAVHELPCISLYQPTHRQHPGRAEDLIRFRNLLTEMERSLRRKYPRCDMQKPLSRLREYERDPVFWNHQYDGLAMFVAPDVFRVLRVLRPVPQLVVVSNTFHLKPLLRIIQSADRFQVLCVSQKRVSLYEGNRYGLAEIELQNVPRSLVEALGEQVTEPHLTVVSAGGPGTPGIRHGRGAKADEVDIDIERYLRAVDRAILERYSGPSGLPLVLAALPQYQAVFRRVSHNPKLLTTGIELHPDRLNADQLREEAAKLFEPWYRSRLSTIVDQYRAARSHQAGSDDVLQVAMAAAHGRVQTALVDADRRIPGRMDATDGKVQFAPPSELATDDLLDDIAERVLATGGAVYVVPTAEMPSATGVAATYRF